MLGEHAPSYATIKNWVAKFKRGDFSTCDAPHPGWPKTVTTPAIIDQIHELILEDCRISAKSIAEKLGISRERAGSFIREDLDMRKLSAKWVQKFLNADQKRQRCHSSEKILKFFGAIQMISCRDWRSWKIPGYVTMTRRQSNNQWSGGIAAHPASKISSTKVRWKSSRLDFLWSRQHPPHWLSSKRSKLSTRSINHLYWCNWRTFWRKNAAERSLRVSCSCTTIPRLTGHLQLRRNWLTWASNVLITHPILRIWPRRTTTCSLDCKNNWKFAIFRPKRR